MLDKCVDIGDGWVGRREAGLVEGIGVEKRGDSGMTFWD